MLTIADGERTFSWWLVTHHSDGRIKALTTRIDGQEVLPVFGFREEAQMFAHFTAPENAWRAQRASAREILSLLYGPRPSVSGVALDPVPGIGSGDAARLEALGAREFADFLLGRWRWSSEERSPVPAAPGQKGAAEAV